MKPQEMRDHIEYLLQQNTEIKNRLTTLEQPATVAPDADLHPVALKLAEAYRMAIDTSDDDMPHGVLTHIRQAWCKVTDTSEWTRREAILIYGLPK